MEMSVFYDQLTNLLAEKLPDDTTMQLSHVRKNNGVIEDGISFMTRGKNISPNVYLAQYLSMYENGRPLQSIADEILEVLRNTSMDAQFEVDDFLDFEKVRKRIVFKLINLEKNSGLLEEIPGKQYMDLAMVFYYMLPDEVMKDRSATILIHRSHLKMWNITEAELEEVAIRNTPKLLPAEIIGMEEMLRQLLGDRAVLEDIPEDAVPMYVMSNRLRQNGAATMAYPDVLGDFADKLGKNLYIIPSSIHEVLLIPEAEHMGGLNSMVQEVNSSQMDPKEVLADHVYYYDRNDKKIISILREESSYC